MAPEGARLAFSHGVDTVPRKATAMETFVVHIHRRTRAGDAVGDALAGIVERTDSAVSRPFGSLNELLALLDVGVRGRPAVIPPSAESSRIQP